MSYVPVKEYQIDKLHSRGTIILLGSEGRMSNSGGLPHEFKYAHEKEASLTCYVKYAPRTLVVEGLSITDYVSMQLADRLRHLYYSLAIRALIDHAERIAKDELIMFFSPIMLPDIVLDMGFNFRKTKGHESWLYRAQKELTKK